MLILSSDDSSEIILRCIASYVRLERTGDKDAAQAMLAVKPSGGAFDVAPTWLVAEASVYSQSEHKRRQRAIDQRKVGKGGGDGGKGGKTDKGGGKGKGKKGKAGSADSPARVPG